MKTISVYFSTVLLFCSCLFFSSTQARGQLTITRNGGGADLIENSLVATSIAVSQGADYLELPVNMSSDDQLVVFKDTTLNRLTDVANLFPARHREDGNYYVVDFSLLELRQLRLRNVFEEDRNSLSLGIPTLTEELTLIRKLNALLGKTTGVVIGLQEPAFYSKEGKDMSNQLRRMLERLSYGPQDKLFLQCADPDELQKIGRWPQAENGGTFSLIQLIELQDSAEGNQPGQFPRSYQHNWLFTNSGLRILASYATAVALPAEIVHNQGLEGKNIVHSLRNYGIKIFIQSFSDGTTPPLQPLPPATLPPAGRPTTDETDFDGLYIDSIHMSQDITKSTAPIPVQNSANTVEKSSLPPFFSNLGLSQPKQINNSRENGEEEHIDNEGGE